MTGLDFWKQKVGPFEVRGRCFVQVPPSCHVLHPWGAASDCLEPATAFGWQIWPEVSTRHTFASGWQLVRCRQFKD